MRVMISNDDGIDSPGIQALARAISDIAEVTVVAPHRERSTAGHSLTLHKPLRIYQRSANQYATSGTPADCIYLGLREIMKTPPDLILSGINNGANLGTDVFYSGTVAAAREGALMRIPSYAFSLVDSAHALSKVPRGPMLFEVAAEVAREVVLKTKDIEFPPYTLLNVNIPNCAREEMGPMVVARQGIRFYANEVTKRTDPRGRDYYWIGGAYAGFEENKNSDCHALEQRSVSISPLAIDCTHEGFLKSLEKKFS